MTRVRRDENQVTGLLAESNVGDGAIVPIYADPTTHALVVSATVSVGGSSGVGNGSGTVTTAGTAVRLSGSSVSCSRVVIYNINDGSATNGNILVAGGSTVLAESGSRNGAVIYPANGMEFKINNLNLLYIDATDNGSKFSYYYES